MIKRLCIGLAGLNILMLFLVLAGQVRPAAGQAPAGVLRGSALEIVDGKGRVRASISIHGPETIDGVQYPETVLLRLSDPKSGPVVKLTAAANGAALGLWDEADGGGVQLFAQNTGSFVKVVDKLGREKVVKP